MAEVDTIRLSETQTVLMLGIGGMGMCGLAGILADSGKTISGTDQNVTALQGDERYEGISLLKESDVDITPQNCDMVIYSDALTEDHPLLSAARAADIPTLMLFEAVGQLSQQYRTIAIAGTHGKSSTTAMLAHILVEAGLDPTVIIGASVPGWRRGNSRLGKSSLFIVEADEYRKHLLHLKPSAVVITTIDFDHPDCFSSAEDVAETFNRFIQLLPRDGVIVANEAAWNEYQHTLHTKGNLRLINKPFENIELAIPGTHMKTNATLAVAMAEQLGVTREEGIRHLKNFAGLGRRFERIGTLGPMEIYTDYGHHPTEIAATLQAAREHFTGKKILTVFEPHTEERFITFFKEYGQALSQADGIIVCPVYRARGSKPSTRNSQELTESLQAEGKNAWHISDYLQLENQLNIAAKDYDVALAFTAGNLDSELRSVKLT